MRTNEKKQSFENKCKLFIDAFLDFNETVRSNEGLNETKLENVCALLENLKIEIQERKSVPLNIADVFIDLYSSIEASAYRHEEAMKNKILLAADKLADTARSVVCE